jgi:hypothetical protein
MRAITKYKADDGVEFFNAAECGKHETNCNEAARIMEQLPAHPKGCDFTNGSGYVQHDKDTLLKVRNEFLEFAKRYTDHRWIQETIDKGFGAHPSAAGRVLGEVLPRSIDKHWGRFCCIDTEFREWGQHYFALNPEAGKQNRIN